MTRAIELSQLGSNITVSDAGNIGIDQASPQGDLHIGNISGNKDIIMHSANNGTARLRFREGGSNASGFNEYSVGMVGNRNAMTFAGQGHGEIIAILGDSGNVGINRTNPDQRLNVSGNIEVNAYDNAGGGNGYYTAKGLIIGNLYDAGKSYTGSDDRTGIVWQERGLDLDFATNDALRLKITYDGNIGIGTTNVTKKLTVYNGSADSDVISMSNDNVGLNLGAWGTGHSSYAREVTINGTRFDQGAAPQLRIGGQGGIKFCVDLNTERFTISSGGTKQIKNGNLNIYQTYIDFSGDQSSTPQTAVALYRPADGRFAISTQNTERFRINNTGKVRVGTGEASYNFEVQGSGNQSILVGSTNAAGAVVIIDGDSNGDGAGADYASLTHDTSGDFQINNRKNGSIIFKAGANETEWARIKHTGQLNINANSESISGRVLIKHSVDYTTTDFDDDPTLYLLNDDRTTGVSEAAIVFAGRNSSGSTFRAAISGNGSTGLKFYTTSNTESDDTPAMIINGSGNVGIGTNNPTQKLHVEGHVLAVDGSSGLLFEEISNGAALWLDGANGDFSGGDYYGIIANNNAQLQLGYAGAADLVINSNGKVNIAKPGTANLRTLSVLGHHTQIQWGISEDVGGFLMSENNGQFGLSGGGYWNGSNWIATNSGSAQIRHDGGGPIVFCTNSGLTSGNSFTPSQRMYIGQTGQVEVSNTVSGHDGAVNIYKATGSNTDKAILRVGYNAAAAFEIYRIRNNGDIYMGPNQSGSNVRFHTHPSGVAVTEKLTILNSGRVGIGTNNPQSELHLKGQLLVINPSNSGQYYQVLQGYKAITASSTWIELAHIGHTHTIEVQFHIKQGTNNYSRGGAQGKFNMFTTYGSSSQQQDMNQKRSNMSGGQITGDASFQYQNSGGSVNYLLRMQVPFSTPTSGNEFNISYVIKGISSTKFYNI